MNTTEPFGVTTTFFHLSQDDSACLSVQPSLRTAGAAVRDVALVLLTIPTMMIAGAGIAAQHQNGYDRPSLYVPVEGTPGSDYVTTGSFEHFECGAADHKSPWKIYRMENGSSNLHFSVRSRLGIRLTGMRLQLIPPCGDRHRMPVRIYDNDPRLPLRPRLLTEHNTSIVGAASVVYNPITPSAHDTGRLYYLRLSGISRGSQAECRRCPFRFTVTFIWIDADGAADECSEEHLIWFTGTDATEEDAAATKAEQLWTAPNPAGDRLFVHCCHDMSEGMIRLTSLEGETVLELELESSSRTGFDIELDLHGVPSGTYILHVESKEEYHSNLVRIARY